MEAGRDARGSTQDPTRNARGSDKEQVKTQPGSDVGCSPSGSVFLGSGMDENDFRSGFLLHRIRDRIRIHGSDAGSDADPRLIDGVLDPPERPSPLLYIILIKEGMEDPTGVFRELSSAPPGGLLC